MARTIVAIVLAWALAGAELGRAGEPRIEDLGWLAGAWAGSQGGVDVEEHWTAPRAGSMLGVNRTVKGDRTVAFEFLRIEADPSGLVYLASPQGRPATPFRLKELSGQRVVFENPEHDFPQRVLYWRDAEDSLHARIEGTRGGRTAAQEWVWRRLR
jgi:hypothetical protein